MLSAPYATAREVTQHTAELLRPPRRMRPSEAAAAYLRNEKDAWSPDLAPMMIEPMDQIASREYQGVVFVGPIRSSKTFSMILGGITYAVTCSPGDVLVVHVSQDTARDFSREDLDRCIRNSPELAARLSPRARDDNVFDKFFRSGMFAKLAWPSASQFSGKTIKYVFITEYDKPENRDNVDGSGSLWNLGFGRITTFMSRGKCVAESSPREDISESGWRASGHEAPPVQGILALYNQGTRARWYWCCVHCEKHFEAKPGLGNFTLPARDELERLVQETDPMSLAESYAQIACPHCGGVHTQADRTDMNRRARWLHEGESFGESGAIAGERRRSQIVSYWLGGVAAAYQPWSVLLLKYFQAMQHYLRTGDEGPLRTTTQEDQAMPYLPRTIARRRSIDDLKDRTEEWTKGVVPAGVRFLIAAVDVQGNRFVVHVYGFGVQLECWLIDRFFITSSQRMEGDRNAGLNPAAYAEDWDVLESDVIKLTYPVDGMDVEMPVLFTVCDSGGSDGVTQRAYECWRRFRDRGHARRFALVKGDPRINAPRVQMTYPDTRGRKDRASGARGDVPLYLINVTVIKDAIFGDLERATQGPGYVHIPRWIDEQYFLEMCAEERTAKGWENKRGRRNEASDLHCYARGACIHPMPFAAERINWQNPPSWAAEPTPGGQQKARVRSLSDLARGLNAA